MQTNYNHRVRYPQGKAKAAGNPSGASFDCASLFHGRK